MMKVKYGPYSPSRIDVSTCPYRFKKEYIDKEVKDEGSLASRRGNVIHEVFELITRGWLVKEPLSWEQVSEEVVKRLGSYLITDREDRKKIIGSVKCYMDNPPMNIEHILGTEENLAVKWDGEKVIECAWDDPECFFRGKIDILQIDETVATIIDHKTQMYVPKDAGTFQMGCYAWLVKKFYPYVTEVRTTLHLCNPDLNFYMQPFTWTLDMIQEIEEEIKFSISTTESFQEFPTIPNHSCTYCPIKDQCPQLEKFAARKMALKKAAKGPLISAKKAQDHASALAVLDENRKVMNSQLQSFTKSVGSVMIPGIEYGYKVSDGWEVPKENKKKLFDLLNSKGVDTWHYVNFDITNLGKSIWRTLPQEQVDEIKKLLIPKKTTRFGARKV